MKDPKERGFGSDSACVVFDGRPTAAVLHEAMVEGIDDSLFRADTRKTLVGTGLAPEQLNGLFPDLPPLRSQEGFSISSTSSEPTWLDSYYEALEFFYWEPQHIGRKKNPSTTLTSLSRVTEHLRKMEVTLNQNFHQFFSLAPLALRQQLFSAAFEEKFNEEFFLYGRDLDRHFDLRSAMQPDLAFGSESHFVSVEMKIGARSSVLQVLQYALLGVAVELQQCRPLQHRLLLLGPGSFREFWKERFDSPADLRKALSGVDLLEFLASKPANLRSQLLQLGRIVEYLRISYWSYSDFARLIAANGPAVDDLSNGAEVYRKLIAGLRTELARRKLANS